MLRHLDGFDHYNTSQLGLKYSTPGSGCTIVTDAYRSAGALYRGNNNASGPTLLFNNQSTWIFGCYIKYNNSNNSGYPSYVFSLHDGVTASISNIQVGVCLIYGSNVGFYVGNSLIWQTNSPLADNLWHTLECKVTIAGSSAGSVEIRIDGNVFYKNTAITTKSTSNSTANIVGIFDGFENNTDSDYTYMVIDHMYILDGQGSKNNDFLGNPLVQTLYPASNGYLQDWNLVGNSLAANNISETITDGDSTYIISNAANQRSTFLPSNLTSNFQNIFALQQITDVEQDIGGINYALSSSGIASASVSGAGYSPSAAVDADLTNSRWSTYGTFTMPQWWEYNFLNFSANLIPVQNQFPGYALTTAAMTSDTAPSGIVTTSGNFSGTDGWFLFDQTSNHNFWGSSVGLPLWVVYQFPEAVTITNYAIRDRLDGWNYQCPTSWTIQGSNDGSTWTTVDTQSGIYWSTNNLIQSFTIASPGSYSYYRYYATANGGDVPTLSQIYYLIPSTAFGTITASSNYSSTPPWQAFAPGYNGWITNGTNTGWLQYQFNTATIVNTYAITPWSADTFPSRSPTAWTFLGSNDGSTWTTLDTQSWSGSNWVSNTPQYFVFSNTTAYSYYRLNITANGGDSYVGLKALGMYETSNNESVVNSYTLTPYTGDGDGRPIDWTFSGSNDGSTWTTLHTVTDTQLNSTSTFLFDNETSYLYYRINVTNSNNQGRGTFVALSNVYLSYFPIIRSVKQSLRISGTNHDSSNSQYDNISYVMVKDLYENSPATSQPFTVSEFNALELGIVTNQSIPSIKSFAPTGAENTTVLIFGDGFTGTTSVQFSGVDAQSFTINSDVQITAISPNSFSPGNITVTNDKGIATSAKSFYSTPSITSFTPHFGVSTSVVFTGVNFTDAFSVQFNGVNATSYTVDSDTQITAVSPASFSTGFVTITTPGGTSTSPTPFYDKGPIIDSFSPGYGESTSVIILGKNLSNITAVTFNGVNATSFVINLNTKITAISPASFTPGYIELTSGTIGSVTSADKFYVGAPTIASFTPIFGDSASVVITGTSFTDATLVKFNGTNATSYTVDSDTQITATSPASFSTGHITVVNPVGTVDSTDKFYDVPTISSFTPKYGVSTSVIITGSNFTDASSVKFNGTNATSYTVDSNTQITAVSPASFTPGTIAIVTPGGTATSSDHYYIALPTITSFTPNHGVSTSIVITGTNFYDISAVKFNGTNATSYTVDSTTQITAVSPASFNTGTIAITNPAGIAVSFNKVYGTPTISSFTPIYGTSTSVTISGANFVDASAVKFNGTDATSYTVNSNGQITATSPSSFTNGYITVITPAGTATSATRFYNTPTITSFTPNYGFSTSVVITGTNYLGTTSVKFNGVDATSYTVDSNTQITAVSPASFTDGYITIATPGGTATSSDLFYKAIVSIASFTPNYGESVSVVISGLGLTGASSVKFNGTDATSYTVDSDLQITAVSPASFTDGYIVIIATLGTATSDTKFYVAQPAITSFNPIFGISNTVIITGNNFTDASAVKFNGTDATGYTVDSDTQITATSPASFTDGYIAVTSPAGTGTSSDTFYTASVSISSFTPNYGQSVTAVLTGHGFTDTRAVKFNGTDATGYTVDSDTQITATTPSSFAPGYITVGEQFKGITSVLNASSINTGLICFIPFHENTSSLAHDISGNGYDATIVGSGGWTTGINGPAINLDGSTSYATIAMESGLSSGPFSTMAVIKYASGGTDGGNPPIVNGPFALEQDSGNYGTGNNHINFWGISGSPTVNGNVGMSNGNIYNVVLTCDGTTTILYVNGTSVGSYSGNSEQNPLSSLLTLGYSSAGGGRFLKGYYDQFRMWNRALTSTEVTNLNTNNLLGLSTAVEGTGTSLNKFYVGLPTITSFTPNYGKNVSVVIAGTNFIDASVVQFNGVNAISYVVNSSTQITAQSPASFTDGHITITTPTGTVNSSAVFYSGIPSITSFTPNHGTSASVTITGVNFTSATALSFNGTAATPTIVSDTEITVTSPGSFTTGHISITNPVGTGNSSANFLAAAPVISGFSPAYGSNVSVVITGSNFSYSSAVRFNGINAISYVVNSDTQITAQSPVSFLTGVITVVNPMGTGTSGTDFYSGTPTVTSFTPNYGSSYSVKITGANFRGATSVQFAGVNAASYTIDSDTQITAVSPSTVTTGAISVTNPAGTGNSIPLFYGVPTITGFSPLYGSSMPVTITGTNFLDTSVVDFTLNIGNYPNLISSLITENDGYNLAGAFTYNDQASVVSSDGTKLYICGVNTNSVLNTNYVTVFNLITSTVTTTINLSFNPEFINLSADGTKLYVAGINSTLAIIDTTTNTVSSTTITLDNSYPLYMGADLVNNKLYITYNVNNNISVADMVTNAITTFSIANAAHPTRIFALNGFLYIQSNNEYLKVNASTYSIVSSINFGSGGTKIDYGIVTNDGTKLIVAYTLSNGPFVIDIVDLSSMLLITKIFNGFKVSCLATSLDDNILYVSPVDITNNINRYYLGVPTDALQTTGELISSIPLTVNTNLITGFTSVKALVNNIWFIGAGNAYIIGQAVTDIGVGGYDGPVGIFNFVNGGPVVAAASVVINSNTQITATSPALFAPGQISVKAPGGSAISSDKFYITQPIVSSFSPVYGSSVPITIKGSFLTDVSSVTFNGVSGTITSISDDTIVVTSPSSVSFGNLVVHNPSGYGTGPIPFSKGQPTITSISPELGVNVSVVITGTNLSGAWYVSFNGTSANFTLDSDTQITASSPSNFTDGNIYVYTFSGWGSSADNFVSGIQYISYIYPNYGISTSINIVGVGFSGASAVKFNGVNAASYTVVSDTHITATSPSSVSNGYVTVVTPIQTLTSPYIFYRSGPTISSVSPNSGSSTLITITGTFLDEVQQIDFMDVNSNIYANYGSFGYHPFTLVSSTEITLTTPSVTYNGQLEFWSPTGVGVYASYYGGPSITGFYPDYGNNTAVTITGINFTGATVVQFNGVNAISFTVDSDTQITATSPSSVTTGYITVTTPLGTVSSTSIFWKPIVISSFTPTSGSSTSVTITGSGFTGANNVSFSNSSGDLFGKGISSGSGGNVSFTIVSDTQITATSPASFAKGPITVSNPVQNVSSGSNFTPTNPYVVDIYSVTSSQISSNFSYSLATGNYYIIQGSNFTGVTTITTTDGRGDTSKNGNSYLFNILSDNYIVIINSSAFPINGYTVNVGATPFIES